MSSWRMGFGQDEYIESQRGHLKHMAVSLGAEPPKFVVNEATDSLLNELVSDSDYGRSRELALYWSELLGGNYLDPDEVMSKLWKLRREFLEWGGKA